MLFRCYLDLIDCGSEFGIIFILYLDQKSFFSSLLSPFCPPFFNQNRKKYKILMDLLLAFLVFGLIWILGSSFFKKIVDFPSSFVFISISHIYLYQGDSFLIHGHTIIQNFIVFLSRTFLFLPPHFIL